MVNTAQTRKATKAKNAFTLVEIMIVVLIIGILLAIAVPNFVRARESSRAKACIANLKAIDSANSQVAMTNNLPNGQNVALNAIPQLVTAGYLKSLPVCPSSGTYSLTTVNTPPTCSVGGTMGDPLAHVIP